MTMAVAALVASGIQAYSTIQQGKYQQTMYNLQAKQAELQGRQNALNYSNQALQVLDRQRKMSSTVVARAAAGGINPFTGSPMTVDQYNAFKAGEEYNLGKENADMAIAGGLAQSQSLQAAGKQAMKQAYFNAAATVAMGVYSYGQAATPGASTGTPGNAAGFGSVSNVGGVQVENLMSTTPR